MTNNSALLPILPAMLELITGIEGYICKTRCTASSGIHCEIKDKSLGNAALF